MQHTKKRSQLEIVAAILKAAGSNGSKGELKTRLVFKSSLSSREMEIYLKLLIGHSLLDYDIKNRRFKCNMKTARYLDLYYRIKETDKTGWLNNEP